MDWREVVGQNKYLNLKSLKKQVLTGKIERVAVNEKGYKNDGKTKIEIYVTGVDGKISLNQESCAALAKVFGDDTDDWIDGRVQVKAGTVAFNDRPAAAILVTPITAKGGKK